MNQIIVWSPRWHDRVVLVADRKLGKHNEIVITEKDANGQRYYPLPMYISGKRAKEFPTEDMPTKAGGIIVVRVIPLKELEKEVI